MLALPSTLYFTLLELAAGGLLVLLLVELRNEVPRGYSLSTGITLWGAAALAWWLRSIFPPSASQPFPPDPTWLGAERVLLVALLVLFAAYLLSIALKGRAARQVLGALAGVAASATLVAAGMVQHGPRLLGLDAPLSVLVGAVALGAAMDGLLLGHWYLVTPRLPEKPLLRITRVLMVALVLQAVLMPVFLLLSANATAAFAELGVFFWLRFLFGVLFPVVIGVLVWKTASVRSMQSATGLFYVLASLVLGGEIAARSIYFLTGLAA